MGDTELRTRLRQVLVKRFNDGELRTLCFDLGIDYDDLPGLGKADKARELVDYMERHESLTELVRVGQQSRPDAPWPVINADHLQPNQSTDGSVIRAGRDVNIPGKVIIGGIQGNVTIG